MAGPARFRYFHKERKNMKEFDNKNLTEIFIKIREKTGLTQEEFAAEHGLSQGTVSRCEREGRANSYTVFAYMMADTDHLFDEYLNKRKVMKDAEKNN